MKYIDLDRLKELLMQDIRFWKRNEDRVHRVSEHVTSNSQVLFESIKDRLKSKFQEKLAEMKTSMADYDPELQKLEVFGDLALDWQTKEPLLPNQEFPTEDHVKDFPVYRRVKLSSVVFKLNSDKTPLMGIQLKFTNGVKSPLFQTASSVDVGRAQEAEIDFERRIVRANVFVSTSKKIYALQLVDDCGEYALDLTFDTGSGDWHCREIPADREIIGLYCNTDDPHYIQNLGLILWTPNLQGCAL